MKHLDRIAALLAKAERTDNPIEAELYLAKAQALATQASVDLAVARARIAKREAREQPTNKTIHIGEPAQRANRHLVALFLSIGHCNALKIDIAHNSTYVIAYGMPSDIEVCETLYASLATQMATSATAWLKRGEWRGDRYRSREGYAKEHTSQTARAAFYTAFIERIAQRLREAYEQEVARQSQRVVDIAPEEFGAVMGEKVTGELVLRAKEVEVRDFYRSSSSARGRWKGYSGSVSRQGGAASLAGREAAARARLGSSREVTSKGPGLSA